MKVMIVVTHLLGTGHLSRAAILARGLQAAGHEVQLVSGGLPVAHLELSDLDLVQLPPLRSDGVDFAHLLDERGAPAGPALFAAREDQLLASFRNFGPDVIVTELFPFGRRMLRREFTALLEAAKRAGCLVAASSRDILNPPSRPAKASWADDMLARYYDAVLVHADRAIVKLDASWPITPALAARLRYTGFIAPPALPAPDSASRTNTVLVAAGGGPVGAPLFAAARAAAASDPDRLWHLLVGGADAEARITSLKENAPPNLVIEPTRPDYRALLQTAAASVSLCGYNTALDVLQSGVRSVFVPFDAGDEVEQSLRAQALAALPGIAVLRQGVLTADRLRAAVAEVCAEPPRPPLLKGLDGARQSADILQRLLKENR